MHVPCWPTLPPVAGEGLALSERIVRAEEAGMYARELPDLAGTLLLGAARGRERCPFHQLPCFGFRRGTWSST
jgi:hypothetical protein